MATYLPIRAFNRSQAVRIGQQRVPATTNTYVDVDDAVSRKELAYHSAIGAVYTTGALTDHNKAALITSGFATDTQSGSAPTNKIQTIASGVYVNRDTAVVVSVSGAATSTNIALAASGYKRIDLVYLDTADNAFKITSGTEVASAGTAVAPTATSTQIALFTVAVSNTTTKHTQHVRVLY